MNGWGQQTISTTAAKLSVFKLLGFINIRQEIDVIPSGGSDGRQPLGQVRVFNCPLLVCAFFVEVPTSNSPGHVPQNNRDIALIARKPFV
jgi:hypothetical protein